MRLIAQIVLPFLIFVQLNLPSSAQSGIITTYAGPGLPVDGSLATNQAIDAPSSVAPDGTGGFYVAVSGQHQVYRVTADGRMNLIAGNGTPGFSGDAGPATSAQLNYPMGIAADASGNLFIADYNNHRIRKVTPEGSISTVAGGGTQGFSGDGGAAVSAELNYPAGVALDSAGNLFIADSYNYRIRKVTPGGLIKTVAGNGTAGFSGDYEDSNSKTATSAQLNAPTCVVIDAAGNLFIADTLNRRIREVTTDEYIHTVAGNGSQGFSGDGGKATSAELSYPVGLALDGAGNLFIADSYNYRIRKMTPDGVISTVAGNGTPGLSGDGGAATSAQLDWPSGLTVDTADNLFIADYVNRRVRKVAPSGVITTVAGNGTQGFSGDGGQAASARFHLPTAVAVDSMGNLFIADSSNSRVRKVTPGGVISTVAGNGTPGFSGDGGQATSAQLGEPVGVAMDNGGNLLIADYINHLVLKVTPTGVISTIAGNGTPGLSGDGGPATSAQLNGPWSVAVDAAGNVFIADLVNHRIRKVTVGGVISTVAGTGTMGFSGDGGQATSALLDCPAGVAVDAAGNLFIVDYGNNRVRKVTPGGIISTVAGIGLAGFRGDGGPATLAQIYGPSSLAIDAAGNLFITDHNNNRIRRITPQGVISTVAGNGTPGFSGDGGLATSAQLNFPMGIAIDATGNMFVADYDNNRIRKVTSQNAGADFFPHIAVGHGCSTYFTVTNVGSTAASGILILTDPQGKPLLVKGILTDSTAIAQPASLGSEFPLTVSAGGTIILSVTGLNTDDPVHVGWGQLKSTSGLLTGMASYEYLVGSTLQKTSGALQSPLMRYARILVDNDGSQGKQTVLAIANPGDRAISVRLALVEQNGTVVDDTVTVTLGPKQQVAEYLPQKMAQTKFKGSLILQGQGGDSFVAIAVSDTRGILTAVPIISENAPEATN
jgi:sugar lactone lactonase YvrE